MPTGDSPTDENPEARSLPPEAQEYTTENLGLYRGDGAEFGVGLIQPDCLHGGAMTYWNGQPHTWTGILNADDLFEDYTLFAADEDEDSLTLWDFTANGAAEIELLKVQDNQCQQVSEEGTQLLEAEDSLEINLDGPGYYLLGIKLAEGTLAGGYSLGMSL